MLPKHRDIAPFLKMIREFLLGRKHVTAHRFADTLSPRTPKNPPQIPSGPPTRLFGNQYYLRDARRAAKPPIDLVEQKKRELAAAAKAKEAAKKAPKAAAAPGPAPAAPAAAAAKGTAAKTAQPDQSKKTKAKAEDTCEEKQEKDKKNMLPAPGKLHQWD